jgi:aminoglycoside phosphotransferase (APT) family kinase protein
MSKGRRTLVESILMERGLAAESLTCVSAAENEVWLTDDHVVRVSSGRFRGAYAHEARVVDSIAKSVPVAPVLAHGEEPGKTEWILSRRVHGQSLARVWPTMNRTERRRAGTELGSVIKALHDTRLPHAFNNPWLSLVFQDDTRLKDAYHAPPHLYRKLLRAAATVDGVDPAVLAALSDYVEARLHYFDFGEEKVLTHCDLHFDNLLWAEGSIAAVLDFEGSRPAPRDQELDTLVRFVQEPVDYVGPPGPVPTAAELAGVLDDVAETYPELFAGESLVPRLEAYKVMWFLTQLLHFPPGRRPQGPMPLT